MLAGPDGVKDVPSPSRSLPIDNELPSRFAAALKEHSEGSDGLCAVAGVAGPILAVVHGAATIFDLDDSITEEINAKARREVRRIAKTVLSESADEMAKDERALDVALAWCATPIVPTYSIGIHLAFADLDEASQEVAADLAWVFRLACRRAQIDLWEDAPMLAVTCRALIETGTLTESLLRDSIEAGDAAADEVAFERAVSSAESEISVGYEDQELSYSRGVSPFVGNMLEQMEGGAQQSSSPTQAFTWARQCSEEMNRGAAAGFRRQISPHIFNNPVAKPHPEPIMEGKDEES